MARNQPQRATLADVAREAGVAKSTASSILRKTNPHYSRYAAETIQRVEQAAARLGYAPSLLAASLRQQHVPHFGVFLELTRPGDTGPMGGLPALLWRVYEGIAIEARQQRRYPVVLTSPEPELELTESPEELDRIVRSDLAGVVAAVRPATWDRHLARWEEWGLPCVSLFDRGTPDQARCFVDLDNQAVGRTAWQYLWEHGHRRAICLREADRPSFVADRLDAFCEASRQTGGTVIEAALQHIRPGVGTPDARDAKALLQMIRDSKTTAIFGATGGATVLSHEILRGDGLAIPGECSLIGIDLPVWPGVAETITEVACPALTVGQAAARLLDERIRGKSKDRRHVLVDPVLRERMSVASR